MKRHYSYRATLSSAKTRTGLSFALLLAVAALVAPGVVPVAQGQACCQVTAVSGNRLSARDMQNGAMFQFTLTQIVPLRVGSAIYANFSKKEVSCDGRSLCGVITSISASTSGTSAAAASGAPAPAGAPSLIRKENAAATAPATAAPATASSAPATPATTSPMGGAASSPPKPSDAPPVAALSAAPISSGGAPAANTAAKASDGLSAASAATVGFHPLPKNTPGGFQKCCTLVAVQGVVGGNGPAEWPAKNNLLGWNFDFQPAQGFPNMKGVGVGSPLWVNFATNQVSCDGVTVCGQVGFAQPLYYQQVVYLDVLPVGVIYVPPGDPSATNSTACPPFQSCVPIQNFNVANTTSTTSTKVIASSGTPGGSPVVLSLTFLGGSPAASPTTSASDSQSVMASAQLSTHGPGGYPGGNDRIMFYASPAFEITYIGAWAYNAGHYVVPASGQSIATIAPTIATNSWVICSPMVFELQKYIAGDTQQADTRCLNGVHTSAAPSAVNSTALTGRQGTALAPAQRLLQLDPFVPGSLPVVTAAVLSANAGAPTAEPSVLSNGQRFQLLPYGAGDAPTTGYSWSLCADSAIYGFGNSVAKMTTTSATATTNFSGGISLLINPVAVAGAALKLATGVELPVPGTPVSMGDAWTITTTVTNSTTQMTQWNVSGNFGGGTDTSNPCNAQSFVTTMYYDWLNHTVAFANVLANGSDVSGSLSLDTALPPETRVVFTPLEGGHPIATLVNKNGEIRLKLPPGRYNYRVLDRAGNVFTKTSPIITVKPNEPLRFALAKE